MTATAPTTVEPIEVGADRALTILDEHAEGVFLHFHNIDRDATYKAMEGVWEAFDYPREEYDPTAPELVADGLWSMVLHTPKGGRAIFTWFDQPEDPEPLAARFREAVPGKWAQPLATNGGKRVVLVAANLVDEYRGARYALQAWHVELETHHTEAIIHSEHTAAEWLLLP